MLHAVRNRIHRRSLHRCGEYLIRSPPQPKLRPLFYEASFHFGQTRHHNITHHTRYHTDGVGLPSVLQIILTMAIVVALHLDQPGRAKGSLVIDFGAVEFVLILWCLFSNCQDEIRPLFDEDTLGCSSVKSMIIASPVCIIYAVLKGVHNLFFHPLANFPGQNSPPSRT